MMGEIKLNSDILWNCNTNEVTGLVVENLKTNKILKEILGQDNKNKSTN